MFLELIKGNAIDKNDNDEIYIRNILNLPDKEEKEEDEEEGLEEEEIKGDSQEQIEEGQEDKPEEGQEEIKKEILGDQINKFSSLVRPWELRVNYKAYKESWDSTENKMIDSLNSELGQVKKSLYNQIEKIIGDRPLRVIELKEFQSLKIPVKLKNNIKQIIINDLQQALIDSHNLAYKELPKKFAIKIQNKVIKPGKDIGRADKFLKEKEFYITGVLEKDILDASQMVLANSIKYDKNLKQTLLALDEDTKLSNCLPTIDGAGRVINKAARIETIARTNIAEAINLGRQTVFNHPDIAGYIQAYQYSAILDDRVSAICKPLNGKIQKDWGNYTPPNHFRCRSILVPITMLDEWDGKEDRIPSSIEPAKGFA